jgi:hypothetical protein
LVVSSSCRRPAICGGPDFKAIYSVNLVEKYSPQFRRPAAIGFAFCRRSVKRAARQAARRGFVALSGYERKSRDKNAAIRKEYLLFGMKRRRKPANFLAVVSSK